MDKLILTKNKYIYFLLGLLVVAVSMGILIPADWAGWIFVWLTFVPFLFITELQENKKLLLALIFIIIMHNLASIINVYFYLFPGADMDAVSFHVHAILRSFGYLEISHNNLGVKFYVYLLSRLFMLDPSKLLGQELSVLAFSLCCVVLVKLQSMLNLRKYRFISLIIFGLIPTYAIWGSVELRESLELLFLLLTVYFSIRFITTRSHRFIYFGFMLLAAFLMSRFHQGLILIAVYLIFSGVIFSVKKLTKKTMVFLVIGMTLCLLIILLLYFLAIHTNYVRGVISMIFSHQLIDYVSHYHIKLVSMGGNTFYAVYFNATSFYTAFISLCKLWVYYLFGPFPWELSFHLNIFIMFYTWFRACLLVCLIASIFSAQGDQKRIRIYMLMAFLFITAIWAFGTNNYGTALRHQMLSDWILILLGVPILMQFLLKLSHQIFIKKKTYG